MPKRPKPKDAEPPPNHDPTAKFRGMAGSTEPNAGAQVWESGPANDGGDRARRAAERARMRYFHGGAPGLAPGDLIVPTDNPGWHRDDCAWCASGADDSRHPDTVYVTTEREYGRYYASRFGRGWLYVVEPVGEVVRSDEDGPETYRCDAARVRSVYERCVVLTRNQRRRVFKMMPPTPGRELYTFEQMERDALLLARRRTLT